MSATNQFVPKSTTLQLKGIAILLMLWLHLFISADRCRGLDTLVMIGDLPLCHYMSRFGNACVSMYFFLSGYGLWIVFQRRTGMHNLRRLAQLYALVALIALLFFPWHSLVNPQLGWTFNLSTLVRNLSGFDTYNQEWWFLFPYALVVLLSPLVFRCLQRRPLLTLCGSITVAVLSILLFVYLLRCVWGKDLYGRYRMVEMIILVGESLMPFVVGAFCAKSGLLVRLSQCSTKYKLALAALLMTVLVGQMWLDINAANTFVGMLLCLVCVNFRSRILTKIGGGSTEMWLVHTFFCTYYFPEIFFSLRYPAVIYGALVLVSYLTARLIQWIFQPIKRLIAHYI